MSSISSAAVTAASDAAPFVAPYQNAAYDDASPSTLSSHYHRGDPLDIPLIDHHLLTQLLLPRLTSAIQLICPQAYMDWTTTTTTPTTSHNRHYNTMRWKRIVEGVLRAFLIAGSCRRIIVRYQTSQKQQNHNDHFGVSVVTPAMHNLGLQIRPSASTSRGYSSGLMNLLQQYANVGSLVLATVVVPTLFKELKLYRKRQLDDHDRQLRIEDIRREEYQLFYSARAATASGGHAVGEVPNTDNPQRAPEHQQYHRNQNNFGLSHSSSSSSTIQQRAQKRQARAITYLLDTILGLGEVFLPPIQLINYIMYLWGRSGTPQLGMQLAGWEFCNVNNPAGHDSGDGGFGEGSHNHQRHVNFQYAHRRLLVEEGLRAVSMIIPPPLPSQLRLGNGGSNNATVIEDNARTVGLAGDREDVAMHPYNAGGMGSNSTERLIDGNNARRRSGWAMMRKKILSFMGVIDEEDGTNALSTDYTSTSETRRYSLTCSMCQMENPSIPYIASCGHCYCYLCLRMAVTDNLSFRCVDCGRTIVASARPKVEVFVCK